jgi:predicted metal-binding protein
MQASIDELARIHRELRREFKDDDVLVMGAGPCRVCEKCAAIENQPCRFPDRTEYSMEGSGIDVVRTSKEQNMIYNAGGGKVGFFALVLYNRKILAK